MSSNPWQLRLEARPQKPAQAPRVARVILPGDQQEVAPMAWRQAGAPAVTKPAQPQTAPAEPKIDAAAQIAQLQQQYERQVKDAHAAGLREGEAAGRTRGLAEVQPVIDRFARTIEEISQFRHRMRKEAEADTIKLALAIARRVLRREIVVDPDAMRGLVVAALEKLQGQELCRVKTHPSHVAPVTACLRNGGAHSTVEVIPDPSLQPGGAIFESTHGNLDASVDSQLLEIERGLADHLRRNS